MSISPSLYMSMPRYASMMRVEQPHGRIKPAMNNDARNDGFHAQPLIGLIIDAARLGRRRAYEAMLMPLREGRLFRFIFAAAQPRARPHVVRARLAD